MRVLSVGAWTDKVVASTGSSQPRKALNKFNLVLMLSGLANNEGNRLSPEAVRTCSTRLFTVTKLSKSDQTRKFYQALHCNKTEQV